MKAKKPFRITFYKSDNSVIFTTKIYSTSMQGAKAKAKKLEPFEWHEKMIKDLSNTFNYAIDCIEFPNN